MESLNFWFQQSPLLICKGLLVLEQQRLKPLYSFNCSDLGAIADLVWLCMRGFTFLYTRQSLKVAESQALAISVPAGSEEGSQTILHSVHNYNQPMQWLIKQLLQFREIGEGGRNATSTNHLNGTIRTSSNKFQLLDNSFFIFYICSISFVSYTVGSKGMAVLPIIQL